MTTDNKHRFPLLLLPAQTWRQLFGVPALEDSDKCPIMRFAHLVVAAGRKRRKISRFSLAVVLSQYGHEFDSRYCEHNWSLRLSKATDSTQISDRQQLKTKRLPNSGDLGVSFEVSLSGDANDWLPLSRLVLSLPPRTSVADVRDSGQHPRGALPARADINQSSICECLCR